MPKSLYLASHLVTGEGQDDQALVLTSPVQLGQLAVLGVRHASSGCKVRLGSEFKGKIPPGGDVDDEDDLPPERLHADTQSLAVLHHKVVNVGGHLQAVLVARC